MLENVKIKKIEQQIPLVYLPPWFNSMDGPYNTVPQRCGLKKVVSQLWYCCNSKSLH